jgi:acetate kinase
VAGLDVLVVNAGSSTLKLSVVGGETVSRELAAPGPTVDDGALAAELAALPAVDAVGHRIVHGGRRFSNPVLVDEAVEREIASLSALAPLHNRPAIEGIERAKRELPGVPQVAVFDTSFHRTIAPAASTYAIPARWRDEWHVHRYGFHGIALEWVAAQVRVPRLVAAHLGGGCSVTAIRDGRSVDTTMGFSPLEGVPMATRSGSMDLGVLLYLQREHGLGVDELDDALEHESGLRGLSGGGSGDVREASPLALDVFVHRVAGAIAAMAAALGGIDALAFSGGIGEHAAEVRERIVARVRFLGEFRVAIVPAREELVIARAVESVLGA